MRRALGLLALLGLVLSGCTEPTGSATDDITTLPVVRDPGDFSSANATAPGEHIHDYWGGRDVVQVLDAQGGNLSASCGGCSNGMRLGRFLPEDGVIVPQGTGWVNVTARIEGTGDPASYEVWVQTAEDAEPWRVGPVTPGGTVRIQSTQQRNDPPHYVLSLWTFEVRMAGPDAEFQGKVGLAATAHRGLPLVPYPPHPDRWGGASELVLLEESQESQAIGYQHPLGSGLMCQGSCPGSHGFANGTVVPHDATAVEVRLVFVAGSVPLGLKLSYHGADTRQLKPVTPDSSTPTPGELKSTITLAPGEADSPYAPRSLWLFRVALDDTAPVRAWKGTYELHVKALRA